MPQMVSPVECPQCHTMNDIYWGQTLLICKECNAMYEVKRGGA